MARATAQETIKALENEIEQLRSVRVGVQSERDRLARELAGEESRNAELYAHNQVLQGDRDRLTATIEVLSRRLASPTAEKELTRSGWRHAAGVGRLAGAGQLTDQLYTPPAPRQSH